MVALGGRVTAQMAPHQVVAAALAATQEMAETAQVSCNLEPMDRVELVLGEMVAVEMESLVEVAAAWEFWELGPMAQALALAALVAPMQLMAMVLLMAAAAAVLTFRPEVQTPLALAVP